MTISRRFSFIPEHLDDIVFIIIAVLVSVQYLLHVDGLGSS